METILFKLYLIYELTNIYELINNFPPGMTASLFTHPLDVVRSRIAFQVSGERIYLGIHHAGKVISRTEGVLAFYKGFIPATMAMIPTIGKFVMSAINDISCLHKHCNYYANVPSVIWKDHFV